MAKSVLEFFQRRGLQPPIRVSEYASSRGISLPVSLSKLMQRTALVLAGGGAKGSFELGAIEYLYNQGLRPDVITGTSVGALNGAKLAEGEGDEEFRGLKGLQHIWYNLMNKREDMIVEEPTFSNLPEDAKNAVIEIVASSVLGSLVGTLAGIPVIGLLLALAIASDEADKIEAFLKSKSWYNLSPIEEKAKIYLNPNVQERIANSGISLRVAMVSLNSTKLRYVTEKGMIIESEQSHNG